MSKITKIKCDPSNYGGSSPVGEDCKSYKKGFCYYKGKCDLKENSEFNKSRNKISTINKLT